MPGIVGLITKLPKEVAERQLHEMVQSLRHEPFYVSGTWVDSAQGVYVGWVARQGSFADGMALHNERGDKTLVFSGEEFPEPGTRRALRERGHVVAQEGPSYLVHRYEEEPDFPKRLNAGFMASPSTGRVEPRSFSMTGSACRESITTNRAMPFTLQQRRMRFLRFDRSCGPPILAVLVSSSFVGVC